MILVLVLMIVMGMIRVPTLIFVLGSIRRRETVMACLCPEETSCFVCLVSVSVFLDVISPYGQDCFVLVCLVCILFCKDVGFLLLFWQYDCNDFLISMNV